jgi:hypothetical protein
MPQTKREKKAAKNESDRLRSQARWLEQKHSGRTLREVQNADDVHETDQHVGNLRTHAPAWAPGAGSIVQLIPGSMRMVRDVAVEEVPAMTAYVAGPIFSRTGAVIAGRGNAARDERRGASVILATARSSSDPYMDAEDTLLFNVSRSRWVWFAPPDAPGQNVTRSPDNAGGPTSTCDPTIHSLADCAANGVEWSPPVQLQVGDAIFIQRGWWHCLLAEAGGVAISIEIRSGDIRGNAPRVFLCTYRHVGTRKPRPSGRDCDRKVARRVGWGSAASVLQLWTPALLVFEFQEANAEAIRKLKGKGKNNRFKPKTHNPEKCKPKKCERFTLTGIPCKKSDCCSWWPCHDWEELLKSVLASTIYVNMPDYIRSGRRHQGLYSSCGGFDGRSREAVVLLNY